MVRKRILQLVVYCLLPAVSLFAAVYAQDVGTVVTGFQKRYASVRSITGNFRQTYRAPGIHQVESGVFWLKRPGLMRWEYRKPEEKLFIADGKEIFLFIPAENQVTVQAFTISDMHNTPLKFLLGKSDITGSFNVTWETEFKAAVGSSLWIRLTPRQSEAGYSFLVLELDPATHDLLRVVIHEPMGNTSEFLFTDLKTNVKVEDRRFQFRIPKGAEVIHMKTE